MTRRGLITFAAVAFAGCSATSAIVGGDNLVHRDAIVYHAEQGKSLVGRQQTEISAARDDARRFERSAAAWESEFHSLESSLPYQLGSWICFLAGWWLLAVLVVFVLRMIVTVWPGGVFGEYLAHLLTAALAVLTCFVTYLTNIPDNVYFRRVIAAKDRLIAELQSQLAATTLAAAGATGAAAAATGEPAAVSASVGGESPASVAVSAGGQS